MRLAVRSAALLIVWPLAAAVPTPSSHFGHEIGADRTVLDWDRVVSYFQSLEKSSPRIREWQALMESLQEPVAEAKPGEWWAEMDLVYRL